MTKKEQVFDGIWDKLSAEEKNVVTVNHLKTLQKWDLKRVLCNVLDVDYIDDAGLEKAFREILFTR